MVETSLENVLRVLWNATRCVYVVLTINRPNRSRERGISQIRNAHRSLSVGTQAEIDEECCDAFFEQLAFPDDITAALRSSVACGDARAPVLSRTTDPSRGPPGERTLSFVAKFCASVPAPPFSCAKRRDSLACFCDRAGARGEETIE